MIQVSSGLLRGVPLRSPSGKQTRPSSERLRQGTFNVLRHFRWEKTGTDIVTGATVFDLFAGTGAWGIEAMSNGATEVCFVESHPVTLKTLQDNLNIASHSFEAQTLAVPRMHLFRRDVMLAYRKLPVARLIFCDPPYEGGWFAKVLALEGQENRLEPGGILLYEADAKEAVPAVTPTLKHYDTKNYGDSSVHFFVKLSANAQSHLSG